MAHVAWGHAAVCPRPWLLSSTCTCTPSQASSVNIYHEAIHAFTCMPAQASICAQFIGECLRCRFPQSHVVLCYWTSYYE